jgi:ribosome-binding protein aMBF1 (putative translation factor)
VGDQIRVKRCEKGWLPQELAEKVNVSRRLVKMWERDRSTPTPIHMTLLKEVLGIDSDDRS